MSISPDEQDRLALPENREERLVRWREYCAALHEYGQSRRAAVAEARAAKMEMRDAESPVASADR